MNENPDYKEHWAELWNFLEGVQKHFRDEINAQHSPEEKKRLTSKLDGIMVAYMHMYDTNRIFQLDFLEEEQAV